VTEPADLAHDVLIQVAKFVAKLSVEQMTDLATGEARLEVVPKGGRRAPAAKATGAALPRPAGEIAATMAEIGDRAAARRYLEIDLKLTIAKLRQLASELGITVRGSVKGPILDAIVEWAVGRRLDSDVISRVGGAR
jgi:hypothetical protein